MISRLDSIVRPLFQRYIDSEYNFAIGHAGECIKRDARFSVRPWANAILLPLPKLESSAICLAIRLISLAS